MVLVTIKYSVPGTQPPIYIAGSFSNPEWQPQEMQFTTDESGQHQFSTEVDVEEGKEYQYKFRIGDGNWWILDEEQLSVTDSAGNRNNILTIPPRPSQEERIIETEKDFLILSHEEGPLVQSTSDQRAETSTLGSKHYDEIVDAAHIESPVFAENQGSTPSDPSIQDEHFIELSEPIVTNGYRTEEKSNTRGGLTGYDGSNSPPAQTHAIEDSSDQPPIERLNLNPDTESKEPSLLLKSRHFVTTANDVSTRSAAKQDEDSKAGTIPNNTESRQEDYQTLARNLGTKGYGIGKHVHEIGALDIDSSLHRSFDGASSDPLPNPSSAAPSTDGGRQPEDGVSNFEAISTGEEGPEIIVEPATPGAERIVSRGSRKKLESATSSAIKDDDASAQIRKRDVLASERAVSPSSVRSLGKNPKSQNFFKVFVHLVFVDWVGKWFQKLWAGLRRQPQNDKLTVGVICLTAVAAYLLLYGF